MQGHCHSCHSLLVRACRAYCCAACSRICELSLPQKSWRDRLLHAILPLIVFIWLGMNWKAVPEDCVCMSTRNKTKMSDNKNEKGLTLNYWTEHYARALVDSWCCKSQYDTALIIKSLWRTFNLIHPRRVISWPFSALGQLCIETDQSSLPE